MKDEISKRFKEEFPYLEQVCDDNSLKVEHEYIGDKVLAFLDSELEKEECFWRDEIIEITDEFHKQLREQEKRFKKQQKINNEVLADKCDEMERLLKEQEKRLILDEDKVKEKVFSVMLSDEKYMTLPDFYVKEIAWKAICQLQEGKDG